MKPAIVLFSGGLDSTTCLALARKDGFTPIALSFRYGQRHSFEVENAAMLAKSFDVEHVIVDIDLAAFGGSALVDETIAVPKHSSVDEIDRGIPVTYVPARNTIFLSFAVALAEVRNANDIYIGVNAIDYSGYPDCRPEFIAAFMQMANLATRKGVEGDNLTIHAPLMSLSKAEIVKLGVSLGIDYAQTHSCYDPTENGACGKCDACWLRAQGFKQAGIADPTIYAAMPE